MKVHLMHRDRDFSGRQDFSEIERAVMEDLDLEGLFVAMADGDRFLFDVARRAVMESLTEVDEIEYRQAALRDCLAHPEAVRRLFEIAVSATQRPKKIWGSFGHSPSLVILHAVRILDAVLEDLSDLGELANECGSEFESEAFTRFFGMVSAELDTAYLDEVARQLKQLRFRNGVLISARLGDGNRGKDYVLRQPNREPHRLARISAVFDRSGGSFRLAPRDESGARALRDLHDQGISRVAEAAEQSANHVVSFFAALLAEVGFYFGALNLHDRLTGLDEPICIPTVHGPVETTLAADGLYDVGLALRAGEKLVGNGIDAAGRSLIMITGANQGGKSTLLRGLGLAQLMMQCGLFVGAEAFTADVRDGVFTHFKREEDIGMRSGKLDEELARMSRIATELRPGSMVLFNESFASTDEQEGSEIARQVTLALLAAGIKVVHVTHMYELAREFEENESPGPLFLRAERIADGTRTFRLIEGRPLSTSFGEDVYQRVFASTPA